MEVITFDSQAYKKIVQTMQENHKEMMAQVNVISSFILSMNQENVDDIWVDSYEVCTFLKIGKRTLQRLRSDGLITFSNIRGRNFYKVGEIKKLLDNKTIKSNEDCLMELIKNHNLYVTQRRNLRKNE